jgi:cytochrome c551/c552
MKRSTLGVMGLTAAVATLAAVRFGGWAVVTVESVPEYLVVGKPTEIVFTVKQHAVDPLSDLSPTIVATSGRREVTVKATRLPKARYRAELVVPETGDWKVVVNSGFNESKGSLLPIKALAAAPVAAVLTDAERGRFLFAGKGCVTCHVHDGVDLKGQLQDFGPDLSDKRFAASYLADFLNNPSIKPSSRPNGAQMPKVELRPAEVPLLVAFINSERKTAQR